MKNRLANFIVETLSKMKKLNFDSNETKKINELINILLNLNDEDM